MDPTVVAAWIAAGVSALTLAGTLAAQYFAYRATSRDAKEQRAYLDRTLTEQRTASWNERFATAAEQLGSDKPAVRLAGVYAMAGLADDWAKSRQTCVDVLCAYLRMPYEPDPGQVADAEKRLTFQANREVRHTVIRVITAHLQENASVAWQGLDFDFRDVVFDGGDFSGAQFSAGVVSFDNAQFIGDTVYFIGAVFSGAQVYFYDAKFSGSAVDLRSVRFSGGEVYFRGAQFSASTISFSGADFTGGTVSFSSAHFSGSTVDFWNIDFNGGKVDFFDADFASGAVDFSGARFSGAEVYFAGAQFSGSTVDFTDADFSEGLVDFSGGVFSGAMVDFSEAGDWSVPPTFSWTGRPPQGVRLPQAEDLPEI